MFSISISTTQCNTNEALALLIDNELTEQQYMNIRKTAKERKVNLYPIYDNVLDSKKDYHPNGIHVTETYARIELQQLVDNTVKRLFLISLLPPIDIRPLIILKFYINRDAMVVADKPNINKSLLPRITHVK